MSSRLCGLQWMDLVARTDEIYLVHEAMADVLQALVVKVATEVARDDDEADLLIDEMEFEPYRDPVSLHEKALDPQVCVAIPLMSSSYVLPSH